MATIFQFRETYFFFLCARFWTMGNLNAQLGLSLDKKQTNKHVNKNLKNTRHDGAIVEKYKHQCLKIM